MERATELERYEKMVSLKTLNISRSFIEPLNNIQNQLEQIGADYEIPLMHAQGN